MITEKRGKHMFKVEADNFNRVKQYYKDNPDALQKDCEKDLELSPVTVRKHLRRIIDEKKNS
ncbi:MAG: hypothetical protein GY793_02805 [Proteobacteria bacterium]|nr:hypothetical protein [Pseudomonadota bacterium]